MIGVGSTDFKMCCLTDGRNGFGVSVVAIIFFGCSNVQSGCVFDTEIDVVVRFGNSQTIFSCKSLCRSISLLNSECLLNLDVAFVLFRIGNGGTLVNTALESFLYGIVSVPLRNGVACNLSLINFGNGVGVIAAAVLDRQSQHGNAVYFRIGKCQHGRIGIRSSILILIDVIFLINQFCTNVAAVALLNLEGSILVIIVCNLSVLEERLVNG